MSYIKISTIFKMRSNKFSRKVFRNYSIKSNNRNNRNMVDVTLENKYENFIHTLSNNNEKLNNLFIFWEGKEYKLINILRELIYLHSDDNLNYKVHFITYDNLKNYIGEVDEKFYSLKLANQADYIRIKVLYKFGGLWLDSDTVVMDDLSSIFNILNYEEGFLIKENNIILWNGVLGTKPGTELFKLWSQRADLYLKQNNWKITWLEIGAKMLDNLYNEMPYLFENYLIFNGLDNMYPINWNNCVEHFINKPYNNYQQIVKQFQPLVVLVNSVYKAIEDKSMNEILTGDMPLNYFINKSVNNFKGKIKNNYITSSSITTDIRTYINNIICNKDKYGLLWINLGRSKDRFNHMTKMLSRYDIKNYRIHAIDGRIKNTIDSIYIRSDVNIEDTILACTLSHIKAINECSLLNHDYFLIAEDDIVINDRVFKLLDKIIEDAPDFDILKLYKSSEDNRDKLYQKHTSCKSCWGTPLYVIPQVKLHKIQNVLYKIENNKFKLKDTPSPADVYIYKNLETYCYKFNLCNCLNNDSTLHPSHVPGHKRNDEFNNFTIEKEFLNYYNDYE